jgi:hypothetical protein
MNLTQPCKSIGTQISSGDIATKWRFGDTFSGASKTQSRIRAQDALAAECRELPVEIAVKSYTFHSQYRRSNMALSSCVNKESHVNQIVHVK